MIHPGTPYLVLRRGATSRLVRGAVKVGYKTRTSYRSTGALGPWAWRAREPRTVNSILPDRHLKSSRNCRAIDGPSGFLRKYTVKPRLPHIYTYFVY